MTRWPTATASPDAQTRVKGAQVNVARQMGEVWRVTPINQFASFRLRD